MIVVVVSCCGSTEEQCKGTTVDQTEGCLKV